MGRRGIAAGAALMAAALAGCSGGSGSGSSSGLDGGHQTGLRAALARIAATAETRRAVAYDDTAALVKLTGKDWNARSAFAQLRGYGAGGLVSFARLLEENPGIFLLRAGYTVSAGQPPARVGLVAGGQQEDKVDGLTKRGWKRQGDHLVAPGFSDVDTDHPEDAQLALEMATVSAGGSNMTYGGMSGKLAWIADPGKQTLAADPGIGALADCLGDVVTADITADYPASGGTPELVATGIRRPKGAGDTPHAVVCASWPDGAAADRYAGAVKTALASGKSLRTDEPYSARLKNAAVRNAGGATHVVAWEADTPGSAMLIFQMEANRDLPALASCRPGEGSKRC